MTLCIAAACQDRRKQRVVIGTDWSASVEFATADIQDKLYWATDNVPVLIAGTVTKAIDVKNTFRQFFENLRRTKPDFKITPHNMADVLRRATATHRRKLVEQYVSNRFGLSYKLFRQSVGNKEIPETVAIDVYSGIRRVDFESHLIMIIFDEDNEPYIYRIDEEGDVEHCEAFAAIGTGSTVAESVLFQRNHEGGDPLGPSVYHVYEAMRLGSIASDVTKDPEVHTINVLYPPGEKKKIVCGECVSKKTKKWLERQFKKYGPKEFARMPLPKNPFEPDF